MKISSLSEFLQICDKLNPDYYILSSENQPNYSSEISHWRVKFNNLSITLSPDRIYFRGNDNMLCIKRVKYITIDKGIKDLNVPITILCETENGTETSTLIVAMFNNMETML